MLLVGCARAEKGFVQVGGDGGGGFGNTGDEIDAPDREPIDAPEQHVDAPGGGGGGISSTLTETNNSTIDDNDAIYCPDDVQGSRDDSYYRIFQPSLSGITGAFQVTNVTFGVWAAVGANGTTVSVGTYTGAIDQDLNLGMITNLSTVPANVPDTNAGENVTVGITATIPAGGVFVVTVASPDIAPDGFALGMSSGGEMHPGYIASSVCGATPQKTSGIGAGALIINVTGSH
jgi:hypothetical protein